MAITLGDAIVMISGDTKPLGKSLQGAERQTTSWVKKAGGLIAAGIGGVVLGGIAAATAGVIGLGKAPIGFGDRCGEEYY